MVDFGSWLRTPALTKVFPALAPVAPQVLRGFFFGLMASSLAGAGGHDAGIMHRLREALSQ